MAPNRQMAPRNDTMRPAGMRGPMNGGGEARPSRPMGGETMRPPAAARPMAAPPAREPAARPATEPRPPAKGEENKPPN
jgi:hypothetical protein